jgi:hypothetical protein
MTTYKTNATARYWTATGNDAGTIPVNTTIELTGNSRTIKDGTLMVYEIATAPYTGKYIEMRYLTAVTVPPPDPDPTQSIMYSRIGDVTIVLRDAVGNVVNTSLNDNEIKWLRHP